MAVASDGYNDPGLNTRAIAATVIRCPRMPRQGEGNSVKKRDPCRRHPPAHSWYRSEGPGATIHFKGDRKDQTALARLTSGHLKILRISRGDKKFNICTKCNMIEATPQHILDCIALVYDDVLKRPDFVLEVTKANDRMDLI
ncbi:hypothetical protein AVEN_16942-1 [Araneus ventricosus]|uniref:Uncharacterized protein n=1 Tax=Araneus ventricosus TaxID=182803 RepID=A0A4Y2D7S5_ARAVE|nr:hypothetical protein AVEN_16942-1 [Araneus ventricosus]